MGRTNNTKIFLSYARNDGADLAQRLERDLAAQGFDAWLDKQRLEGGAKWIDEIAQQIDSREVLLVLMTPGSYASEVCRLELVRAWRKGKRLIPLLAEHSETPFPLEGTQYINFTSDASYDGSLLELRAAIEGGATAVLEEKYRQTRLTYVTAPPTVANYIERPEALRALREVLFADVADGQRQPIALTALVGMGGLGKTVLAKALTQDEVVQQAFPDGIVWITTGKESNYDPASIVSMFHRIGRALGEDWERLKDPMACQDEYRTAMAKKAALVIVDDVWKKSDLDPFLAESKRSRLLFTTRDAAIARFVGAREHTAQLMGRPLTGEADAIIDECGSLPLALSQIGAVLRDAGPEVWPQLWKDTLDLLRKADLKGIAEQLPPGQDSFFRAVEVSFKALAPDMQERYKALAVLLEDMAAPLPILQTLWASTTWRQDESSGTSSIAHWPNARPNQTGPS